MRERAMVDAETGAGESSERLRKLSAQLNSLEPVEVACALQELHRDGIPSTPQQALQLCNDNVITSLALLLERSFDALLRCKCMQLIARMAMLHSLCQEAFITYGAVKNLYRYVLFSDSVVTVIEATTALRTLGCLLGGLTAAPSQQAAMEELVHSGLLRRLRNELASRRPPDDVAAAIGDFLASVATSPTNHIHLCEAGMTSLLPTWLDPSILDSSNSNGISNCNGQGNTGGFLEAVLYLSMSEAAAATMRTESYFDALARVLTYGSTPPGLRRTALLALCNLYGADVGNSRADELLRTAGAPAMLAAALTAVLVPMDAGAAARVMTSASADQSQRSGGSNSSGRRAVRAPGVGGTRSRTVITASSNGPGAAGTHGSTGYDASNVGAVAWVNVHWAFGDGSPLGVGSNGSGVSPTVRTCGEATQSVYNGGSGSPDRSLGQQKSSYNGGLVDESERPAVQSHNATTSMLPPLHVVLYSIQCVAANPIHARKLARPGSPTYILPSLLDAAVASHSHAVAGNMTRAEWATHGSAATQALLRLAACTELVPVLRAAGAMSVLRLLAKEGGDPRVREPAQMALLHMGDVGCVARSSSSAFTALYRIGSSGVPAVASPELGNRFQVFVGHHRADAHTFAVHVLLPLLVQQGVPSCVDVHQRSSLTGDWLQMMLCCPNLVLLLGESLLGSATHLQEVDAALGAGVNMVVVVPEGCRWLDDSGNKIRTTPPTAIRDCLPARLRDHLLDYAPLVYSSTHHEDFTQKLMPRLRLAPGSGSGSGSHGLSEPRVSSGVERVRVLPAAEGSRCGSTTEVSPVAATVAVKTSQKLAAESVRQECGTAGGAFLHGGFGTSGHGNGGSGTSGGKDGLYTSASASGNGVSGTSGGNGGFGASGSSAGFGTSDNNGVFGASCGNGVFDTGSGNIGLGISDGNGDFGTGGGNCGFGASSSGKGALGSSGGNSGLSINNGGANDGFVASESSGNGVSGTSADKGGLSIGSAVGGFGTISSGNGGVFGTISSGNGSFGTNSGGNIGFGASGVNGGFCTNNGGNNGGPWALAPSAALGGLVPSQGFTTIAGQAANIAAPVASSDDVSQQGANADEAVALLSEGPAARGPQQGLPWPWSRLLGDVGANNSSCGGPGTAATEGSTTETTEDPLLPARNPRCLLIQGNGTGNGTGNSNTSSVELRASGSRRRMPSGGGTAEGTAGTDTALPLSYGCRRPAVRQRSLINRHAEPQAAQDQHQMAALQDWMTEYHQQQQQQQQKLQQRRVQYGPPCAQVGQYRVAGSTARNGGALGEAVSEASASMQSQLLAVQLEMVRYEMRQAVQTSHETISYKIEKLRSDVTEQIVQLRFDLAGKIEALQAGIEKVLETAAAPPPPPPGGGKAGGVTIADGQGGDPSVRVGTPDVAMVHSAPPPSTPLPPLPPTPQPLPPTPTPPPPPTPPPTQQKLAQVLSASLAAAFQDAVHKAVTQWQTYVAAAAAVPPPLPLPVLAAGVKPSGLAAVGGPSSGGAEAVGAGGAGGKGGIAVVQMPHKVQKHGVPLLAISHPENVPPPNIQQQYQFTRGGGGVGGGAGGGAIVGQPSVTSVQPAVMDAAAAVPYINASPVVRAGTAAWSGDGSLAATAAAGMVAPPHVHGGSGATRMRNSHPGFTNSTFLGSERLIVNNTVAGGGVGGVGGVGAVKNRNSHSGITGIGGGGGAPLPGRPAGAVPVTPNPAVPPRAGLLSMFDAALAEDARGGGGGGNTRHDGSGRATVSMAGDVSSEAINGEGGSVAAQVASILTGRSRHYLATSAQMDSGSGGEGDGGGAVLARAPYGGPNNSPPFSGLQSSPTASRLVERSEVQHVHKAQQHQLLMLQQQQQQQQHR